MFLKASLSNFIQSLDFWIVWERVNPYPAEIGIVDKIIRFHEVQ